MVSPMPLNGGQHRLRAGRTRTTANRAYLPAARNGFVELVELAFPGSVAPGAYSATGTTLLAEWRARLGDWVEVRNRRIERKVRRLA